MRNRKYRRRVFFCLLAGVMLISLAACGKTSSRQTTKNENDNGNNERTDVVSDSGDKRQNTMADGESKILIAYFTAAEN